MVVFNSTLQGPSQFNPDFPIYIYRGGPDGDYGVHRRLDLPSDGGTYSHVLADLDLDGVEVLLALRPCTSLSIVSDQAQICEYNVCRIPFTLNCGPHPACERRHEAESDSEVRTTFQKGPGRVPQCPHISVWSHNHIWSGKSG